MKVFLDTHVWLSGLVFSGLCEDIILRCAQAQTLYSSQLIRNEVQAVLVRKFEAVAPKVIPMFDLAWSQATRVEDVEEPADDADKRLVRAACLAEMDLFVTGDKRVLSWADCAPTGVVLQHLKIQNPRTAWVTLFGAAAP